MQSSLLLQQLLYYHAYYSACWLVAFASRIIYKVRAWVWSLARAPASTHARASSHPTLPLS